MHFCITGQYTPQAITAMMDNPATDRFAAARQVADAAGGKLVTMFATLTQDEVTEVRKKAIALRSVYKPPGK